MIKTIIHHAKKHPGFRVTEMLERTQHLCDPDLELMSKKAAFALDTSTMKFPLIPQFFFVTLGITGATLYLVRLARGPHVTFWDKKNNPEPWTRLDPTYQYKFVAVNTDYKSLKKDGPDF